MVRLGLWVSGRDTAEIKRHSHQAFMLYFCDDFKQGIQQSHICIADKHIYIFGSARINWVFL